jgi:hypothetical protein
MDQTGMNRSMISKLLVWLAAVPAASSVLFASLAIQRSGLPYNSEGSYFDGVVNYHEQSVLAFGILAGISIVATAVLVAAARSLHRGPTSEPMGHALFSLAHVCLSAFFGWAFYVRYWKWRECIEQAASSCITPEGDSLIEGGSFWLIPSVLFAVAAVRRMWRWRAAQQAHARDVRNARA